jgi:biotin carboxyl carrier protein
MRELVKSPLPGKVLEYWVEEGDSVMPGDVLVVVEAMKMHNEICADISGTVSRIIAPVNEYIPVDREILEIN